MGAACKVESLFERLKAYGESPYYPYHMPGHKRRAFGGLAEELAKLDITEIEGFDNLHQPEGILRELQEKAAVLYGAEESFYLVNGSTGGILSAISAALPRGGHLLMARGSHKSAYHAAYLRDLTVSYLYAPMIAGYDVCDAVTPEQVGEMLRKEPDIGAVFVVSPTYEGRIADIRRIAEIVHEKNIPLIVDEAHGAHLGMAEGFGENSCQAGADIVIHSVHKTLPAMTQAALLHINGNRIQRERLRRFLHIYQTSSPSYVLMASIDNALQAVSAKGAALFAKFRTNFFGMMERLAGCRHLQFLPFGDGRQDVGKLVVSARRTGISGQRIYNILLREYYLQLEMASVSFCLAMFTVGDSEEAYERMAEALLAIDGRIEDGSLPGAEPLHGENGLPEDGIPNGEHNADASVPCRKSFAVTYLLKEQSTPSLPLAKAWDMDTQQMPLKQAAGHYAGEFVNLYPPGVPILVPGECITEKHCRYLAEYVRQGLKVQGIQIKHMEQGQDECWVTVLKTRKMTAGKYNNNHTINNQ